MRLLLVEDDERLSDMLRRALEREGYAVDHAANGEDALWLGVENDYDTVVLDVMIPAPDGYTVVRQLRAQARDGGAPLAGHKYLTRLKIATALAASPASTRVPTTTCPSPSPCAS